MKKIMLTAAMLLSAAAMQAVTIGQSIHMTGPGPQQGIPGAVNPKAVAEWAELNAALKAAQQNAPNWLPSYQEVTTPVMAR